MSRFHTFGQPMQRANRAQAGRRVSGVQLFAKVP
jgi:hypothetical protein